MSHLTSINLTVSNQDILKRLCKAYGYEIEYNVTFENSFSGENVENAILVKDENKTILVLDQRGKPVIDEWSMGTGGQGLLQQYTIDVVKQNARRQGADCEVTYDQTTRLPIITLTYGA